MVPSGNDVARIDLTEPTTGARRWVGELHLIHEKLDTGGMDGMQLVIHHAAPGSDSAQTLALLGNLVAAQNVLPCPETE